LTLWQEFSQGGFSGFATINRVSDSCFRISGLLLLPFSSGTISLFGEAGDVKLSVGSEWLSDMYDTSCSIFLMGNATVAPAISVTKSGTTPFDFLITLSNQGPLSTSEIDIVIRLRP
jgi:hypothetical protein